MPIEERAAGLPLIVVGRCGESQLVQGWHEREQDGRFGIPYCASGASARLALRAIDNPRWLCLLLSAPVGLTTRGVLAPRITFNKKRHELPLQLDSWVLRSFKLEPRKAFIEVRFEVPDAVVPDAVLKNGDARKLGVFLSAIWQE